MNKKKIIIPLSIVLGVLVVVFLISFLAYRSGLTIIPGEKILDTDHKWFEFPGEYKHDSNPVSEICGVECRYSTFYGYGKFDQLNEVVAVTNYDEATWDTCYALFDYLGLDSSKLDTAIGDNFDTVDNEDEFKLYFTYDADIDGESYIGYDFHQAKGDFVYNIGVYMYTDENGKADTSRDPKTIVLDISYKGRGYYSEFTHLLFKYN